MFVLLRYIGEREPGLVTHLHEGGYVIISDGDSGIDKAVYEKYI